MTVQVALVFVIMVMFTVGANIMLKLGTGVPAPERWLFNLLGTNSLIGLALFGCAGLIYAWVLRAVPLDVAQSFVAAQFVAVIVASALLLAEPIPLVRWAGIALIVAGIVLVGLTIDSA